MRDKRGACGSIAEAIKTARDSAPGKPVEVEVENLAELEQALAAGPGAKLLFHSDRYDLSAHPHLKPVAAGESKMLADVEDSRPDLSGAHLFLKNVTDLVIESIEAPSLHSRAEGRDPSPTSRRQGSGLGSV